jgi:hypothetical protein
VDPDEIRALEQQPGGDMTLGGVDLVETFRRLDLVDEYRLYVDPVVVGHGRRLCDTADEPTDLELGEDRRFGNGVVLLRYAVRRPRDPAPASSGQEQGRDEDRREPGPVAAAGSDRPVPS